MYQVKSERRFCGDMNRNRLVTRDNRNHFRLYVDGKFHSVIATAWDRIEVAERHAQAWVGAASDAFFAAEKAGDVRAMRLAFKTIGV